jgi:MFS family permease
MTGVRRLVSLACAIVLVDTIFYAALVPLVPYYSGELGLSKSGVGILSGAYGAGVLVGAAPGGYLASRAGVRSAAITGLSLLCVSTLVFGFAETELVLVGARFLAGFGSSLSWVAALTWIVLAASDDRRGELLGVMLSFAVFGALLGPVLGSVAASVGVAASFSAIAAASVVILIWAAVEPAPTAGEPRPFFAMLARTVRPHLVKALWFVTLSPLVFASLAVLVPLQLDGLGWGAAAVGGVFLASAAVEAVAHPLLGRWSDRSGFRPPILAGILTSIGILLLLPLVANPWVIALLVVLAGIAFNATLVPGTNLFSHGAEKADVDQAIAFGVTNFAWAAGYAVGATLSGFLADLRGDALSYGVLAVVCLATLLLIRTRKADPGA